MLPDLFRAFRRRLLLGISIWLACGTKDLLIGESANPSVIRGIRYSLAGRANIEYVNEVLSMHMGPDFDLVHIGVDIKDPISA